MGEFGDLFPVHQGMAARLAKKMDKTKVYTVDDISTMLTDDGKAYQGKTNLLAIASKLRAMGFKVNESNFVKTFENFTNGNN